MPTAAEKSQENRHLYLSCKIATIFDEVRASQATHIRKLKELVALRSITPPVEFSEAFCRALTCLFNFQRRTTFAERVIKFVSVFSCSRGAKDDRADAFLEYFLKFLLVATAAANKTPRFRACQIVSEIIMRLPDDAEVSSEIWDEVIDSMKLRMSDKIPAVRTFAVRALSRFANDSENGDILELFLEKLPLEQNSDVRKTLVLSMPPSSATLPVIIDCTLDVSESVRKAAYYVLGSKFPLQSLSIKSRTIILQRGLADRSMPVKKECLKLMKDEWLEKSCNGDPIEMLKFLDVETYESVGESAMSTLLKAGLVKLQDGQSIRKSFVSSGDREDGSRNHLDALMDAEVAIFWRMVCKHLQMQAHTKGTDAAMTMGTEAAVYAAEASDNNDLLDSILPASVSEYVELVNAHIAAGSNYRFTSRQLLLLGAMLDFSDASNRKVASQFVQDLLHIPLDHEVDDGGNEVVIGDGFSLGGERNWAAAVGELAKKVHVATGEFEEVVLQVVEELARPCRERTADCKQWLHCLAVTSLLLENTTSFRPMQGRAIDPSEILHSLLLPGAKHAQMDVQRAAIRCLGLFGLLERKPSENLVKQLRCSFVKGPPAVTIMASKALLDLGIWHGPDEIDNAMNCNLSSQFGDHKISLAPVEFCNGGEDIDIELLDLLYVGFEHDWGAHLDTEDNQSIQCIIGEGFAKILLLSNKYPRLHASAHHMLLAKLISLYFSQQSEELQRLRQCLSVFFEHYPTLSANHKVEVDKEIYLCLMHPDQMNLTTLFHSYRILQLILQKCISKAFLPAMRSLWPGIDGNVTGSTVMVSNMRKRAVQASRFMLQMIQVPFYAKKTTDPDDNKSENPDAEEDTSLDFESGEEGLAIRIAVEVAGFLAKKTAAEKSYISALCKVLVLLQFRVSEQGAVKLMRRLLNRVSSSVATEKDLVKELRQMAERLQTIDGNPEEMLSPDQANLILGRMELAINLEEDEGIEVAPTPAPRTARQIRSRRRAIEVEESSSDDEVSPTSVVPAATSTRSQRASKTAAMTRMKTKTTFTIDEDDEGVETEGDDGEGSVSEVTSEDDFEQFE